MCTTCGCSPPSALLRLHDHQHEHEHELEHQHEHEHEHDRRSTTVALEHRILSRNDQLAAANRHWLSERRVTAINLLSSPGAGKTTLLERTIDALQGRLPLSVIEGDQATDEDARRIRRTGCPALQVNTGTGCHLDAAMIDRALGELSPPAGSLLFIENVGNLVCPALFDLGETAKVVVASVTEGEDKPLKYPHMFRAADLILLNKVDLLPHLRFDADRFCQHARAVNPRASVLPISATTGDGLADWYGWLHDHTGRGDGRL
jgi:hydrogenase nickel incorporation protein HypB